MTFGYSGPSATAVFVAGAFNDAQANAKSNAAKADAAFSKGDAYLSSMPQTPTADSITLEDFAVAAAAVPDSNAFYEYQRGLGVRDALSTTLSGPVRAFQDKLTTDITSFFTTYFPNTLAPMTASLQQLRDQIRSGGLTVKPSVSGLRYQQAVDPILNKFLDDERAVIESFAAKRYAVPPGALIRKLSDLQEASQRQIAQISNKLALDQFDAELEVTRSSMDKAIMLRGEAVDRFGEYLSKWVVLRYDQLTMEASEQEMLVEKMREVYMLSKRSQLETEAFRRGLALKEFGRDKDAKDAYDGFNRSQSELLFRSALDDASRLSQLVATAFNVLRGSAAVTSNETS